MCNMDCIKWTASNFSLAEISGRKVLEVGSYDVNGSLRYIIEMLEPYEYVGVDIIDGPGVDAVCPAQNLVKKFGEERFDVVISTCMLEHTKKWAEAVSNIKRVCKKDGIILLIVPSNWRYHGHPNDYWRYSKEDIKEIFSDCIIVTLEEDPQPPSLVYAKIRKPIVFVERDLANYKVSRVENESI